MPGSPGVITRRYPTSGYTESANQEASKLREVYRRTVPRGVVWRINPAAPFLCWLTTRQEITPGGTGSQVLTTTYLPCRVLGSPGTHVDGNAQGVYLKADGTVRTISAVDDHIDSLTTKTITISDATAAAHMVCYVPFALGRLVVKIEAPRGMGDLSYPIFEIDTRDLHSMNQWRDNRIESPFPLPPDYSLVFYLDAAWPVYYVSGTTSGSINLPYNQIQIPIIEAAESEFFVVGERKPGAKLRMDVETLMKDLAR